MNTSKAISAFLRAIGSLPKSDLTKLAHDLNDSIEPGRDIWNDSASALAAETPIGPREAASGGGAAVMTQRYSDPAPQSELTALVATFGKRLDATEETIKAQTALIRAVLRGLDALSKGQAFPTDGEGANGGSEAGEESDRRKPANTASDVETDEAAKGRIPVIDLASMFDAIGSRSKSGLTSPPSFVTIKGGRSLGEVIDMMRDDPLIPDHALMAARSYQQAAALAAAGTIPHEIAKARFDLLPYQVKDRLQAA